MAPKKRVAAGDPLSKKKNLVKHSSTRKPSPTLASSAFDLLLAANLPNQQLAKMLAETTPEYLSALQKFVSNEWLHLEALSDESHRRGFRLFAELGLTGLEN